MARWHKGQSGIRAADLNCGSTFGELAADAHPPGDREAGRDMQDPRSDAGCPGWWRSRSSLPMDLRGYTTSMSWKERLRQLRYAVDHFLVAVVWRNAECLKGCGCREVPGSAGVVSARASASFHK
jgi:hypothetical protein